MNTIDSNRSGYFFGAVALLLSSALGCGGDAPPEPASRTAPFSSSEPSIDQASADAEGETASASTRDSAGARAVLASNLSGVSAGAPEPDDVAFSPRAGHTHHELRTQIHPKLSPEARASFAKSLENRLSRSMAGLAPQSLGALGEGVDPAGRFQHVVVQVRDENGNLRTECIESRRQLDFVLGRAGQK